MSEKMIKLTRALHSWAGEYKMPGKEPKLLMDAADEIHRLMKERDALLEQLKTGRVLVARGVAFVRKTKNFSDEKEWLDEDVPTWLKATEAKKARRR